MWPLYLYLQQNMLYANQLGSISNNFADKCELWNEQQADCKTKELVNIPQLQKPHTIMHV